MFSFPTVLALQNARVHVHALNCCNMTTDVKVSINKTLGLGITLSILYVYPNHYYVRLWKSFNNAWSRSKDNIVKDMSSLKNFFDYVYSNW